MPVFPPVRAWLVLLLAAGTSVRGGVLPNPAITASATPYNASFVAANVFDNGMNEYASLGLGAATFLDFDFGAPVSVDGFLAVTRNNANDTIGNSRLVFDTDGVEGFDPATDSLVPFTPGVTGNNGKGFINRFPSVTARRVRWQVLSSIGSAHNLGAMEMRFLSSAPGTRPLPGVAVIAAFTPYNGNYAAANAANGVAGRGTTAGVEYAGLAGGVNTFVDFDLGAERPVTGFDFFDRIAQADRITGFDLVFANHPSFAAPHAVQSFANTGFSRSDDFAAPFFARYVRFDVTSVAPGVSNAGIGDLIFQTAAISLPTDFSSVANPASGWTHGTKPSPQSSDLEPFDQASPGDSTAPCARWHDGAPETGFAGVASADAGAFAGWGGAPSDWESGGFYHAWRDGHSLPVASRWMVTDPGFHRLSVAWESHSPLGATATVSVVVNGTTLVTGPIGGFSGSSPGATAAFGTHPFQEFTNQGIVLQAGDRVDFVTAPASTSGNLLLRAAVIRAGAPPEPTDTVVIREFGAANDATPVDEDGDASDWIELYNGTGAAVDLTGWRLTDDASRPDKWVFPPRTLAYGDFLVVYASDKDALKRPLYTPASELHTNFKLSATGEYLALLDGSGMVVQHFSPAFPAQYPEFSYGLGSNQVTGYLVPTPAGPNGPATDQPLFLPVVTPASRLFTGSLEAHIAGALPGQVVRYTTDGSEPTTGNGLTYTGTAIPIAPSTTLRARFLSSGVSGPIADAHYIRMGTSVANGFDPATFSGSLPLLVVDTALTPDSTTKTAVPARFALIEPGAPGEGLGRTPTFVTRGTLKPRGQTSLGLPKKPYGIEFWDGADRPRDLEVLGMPADSDWVLYAAYQYDTDMLRNVLAYEIYRQMGRWAPRTRFVEVLFNGGGGAEVDGSDYHGVYVLMEKIKRGRDRVDITGIGPLDNTGEDLTGGYLLAHDKFTAAESLETQGGSLAAYPPQSGTAFIVNSPNVSSITPAQRAYLWQYIQACDAAIAAPSFTHPVTGLHYRDYIRRDTFIDHHLVNAFAKNVDGLRISTYFEKDRGGKLGFSSVWDFDRSMDSDTDGRDDLPGVWNPDNDNGISSDFFSVDGKTAEGWFHRLHQDPDYLQEWVDRYDRWRSSVLATSRVNAFLDAEASRLVVSDNPGSLDSSTPVARNWQRWPRTVRSVAVNGANAATQLYGPAAGSELSRHKTWISSRLAFMDSWVLAKPVPVVPSGVVSPGTELSLASPHATGGGTIQYTLDGTDPRAPGGGVSSSAIPYGSPLPLSASTRVLSRVWHTGLANQHTPWSALQETVYIVNAQPADAVNLVLTELMYHPADPTIAEVQAGFVDADDFEYLELHNRGEGRVNLWECRFSEGIDFAFRDALRPGLTEIPAGETVLIVKNLAAFSLRHGSAAAERVVGEFAGDSNLSNSGETITLLDRAGTTLLRFTYDDAFPWPDAADGSGPALHVVHGSYETVGHWFAHAGHPGQTPVDTDGDGQSDWFEVLAGSNAGNASQSIQFAARLNPAGGVRIIFDAFAGRRYQVHRSPDLETWEPVGLEVQPGTDGPQVLEEPATDSRLYYRLEVLPAP